MTSSENIHDHISLALWYILHIVHVVSLLDILKRLASVESGVLEEKDSQIHSFHHNIEQKQSKGREDEIYTSTLVLQHMGV